MVILSLCNHHRRRWHSLQHAQCQIHYQRLWKAYCNPLMYVTFVGYLCNLTLIPLLR